MQRYMMTLTRTVTTHYAVEVYAKDLGAACLKAELLNSDELDEGEREEEVTTSDHDLVED